MAQSMEELFQKTGYQISTLKGGELIEGRITDIGRKMVLIDVGGKTEGMVVGDDYEEVKDFIKRLSVDDQVLCYVKQPENEQGQIILSLRKAANDWKWHFFEEKKETGEVVQVKAVQLNKGGMVVEGQGLQGFIPASQFGRKVQDHLENLLHQNLKTKVIEVERANNRLIFSERAVSEAKLMAKKRRLLGKIKVGQTLTGQVSGVTPFGLFVETQSPNGGLEGLVHISEISWEKVEKPEDYYQEGDEVKVKVIDKEEETGRLNLSIKQITPDPWEKVAEKYPVGEKIKGQVGKLVPFGAFVNLEPGVDGLLHISKIPVDFKINPGDEVKVEVENLDVENRRLSLSLILKKKPLTYK